MSREPTGRTESFFFLPPIAPQPEYSGQFVPDLTADLKVDVELLVGDDQTEPVASFADTPTDTSAGETIRVNPVAEHYIVNFHSGRYNLTDGATYRIFVRRKCDDAEYGYADVRVCASRKQVKSLVAEDTFVLKNGRTLPIKFRVEVVCRIAFTNWRHGNRETCVMDPDGTN